jgi:toxin ParE1/3/4
VTPPPYRIRKAALTDLIDIARYTRKTWSREQEAVYTKGLFDCFEKIARGETHNRDLSGIMTDCIMHQVGHHLIIFRWLEDGRPEIIRVLHERMNVSLQLVKPTT